MIATHFPKVQHIRSLKGALSHGSLFLGIVLYTALGAKVIFYPGVLHWYVHDSRLFSEDILTAFYHHISLHVPQLLYLFKIRATQPTNKNAVHVGRNPGRFITFSGYQIPSPQSFQLLASLPHIYNATQCNFFHMMEYTRLPEAFVFCFKEYLLINRFFALLVFSEVHYQI